MRNLQIIVERAVAPETHAGILFVGIIFDVDVGGALLAGVDQYLVHQLNETVVGLCNLGFVNLDGLRVGQVELIDEIFCFGFFLGVAGDGKGLCR